MKKENIRLKEFTKTHCPGCGEKWENCICENLYPEQDLIDQDDQNIEDSFNIF